MRIKSRWCCILINDSGGVRLGTNEPIPLVESAMGPYNRDEAEAFERQFNEEYDGSPWRVIIRPIVKLELVSAKPEEK